MKRKLANTCAQARTPPSGITGPERFPMSASVCPFSIELDIVVEALAASADTLPLGRGPDMAAASVRERYNN